LNYLHWIENLTSLVRRGLWIFTIALVKASASYDTDQIRSNGPKIWSGIFGGRVFGPYLLQEPIFGPI